jgi:AcrR family transcriptional regulator
MTPVTQSKQAPAERDPVVERVLRADARRNHEAVIGAAKKLFADEGLDAQMPDVAKAAKVGVGTVYRHFPTKEALLEALAREQFDTLTEWAREAQDAPDAWEAFTTLMWRGAELQASDRALMEAVADFKPSVARQAEELHACMARVIARAQEQGTMRPDASGEDVRLLMCGLGSVMQMAGDGWRRYLTVMLDGLRV